MSRPPGSDFGWDGKLLLKREIVPPSAATRHALLDLATCQDIEEWAALCRSSEARYDPPRDRARWERDRAEIADEEAAEAAEEARQAAIQARKKCLAAERAAARRAKKAKRK